MGCLLARGSRAQDRSGRAPRDCAAGVRARPAPRRPAGDAGRHAQARAAVQRRRAGRRHHHERLDRHRGAFRVARGSALGAAVHLRLHRGAGAQRRPRRPRRPHPPRRFDEPLRLRRRRAVQGIDRRDAALLRDGGDSTAALRPARMGSGGGGGGAARAHARRTRDRPRSQVPRRRAPAGTSPPTPRRPSPSRSWSPSFSFAPTSGPRPRSSEWARRS